MSERSSQARSWDRKLHEGPEMSETERQHVCRKAGGLGLNEWKNSPNWLALPSARCEYITDAWIHRENSEKTDSPVMIWSWSQHCCVWHREQAAIWVQGYTGNAGKPPIWGSVTASHTYSARTRTHAYTCCCAAIVPHAAGDAPAIIVLIHTSAALSLLYGAPCLICHASDKMRLI